MSTSTDASIAIHACAPFSVVVHADPQGVTLCVAGELDGEAWPCLERALLSCSVVDVDGIVIDLSAVSFVSLSAFRHLRRVLDELRREGRVVTVKPCRVLTRLISLVAAGDGALGDHSMPLTG